MTTQGARPAVASLPLSGARGISQGIDSAVQSMVTSGVSVVVAAGNDYGNACDYSPARVVEVSIQKSPDSILNFSIISLSQVLK